jgi:hypothetical protein
MLHLFSQKRYQPNSTRRHLFHLALLLIYVFTDRENSEECRPNGVPVVGGSNLSPKGERNQRHCANAAEPRFRCVSVTVPASFDRDDPVVVAMRRKWNPDFDVTIRPRLSHDSLYYRSSPYRVGKNGRNFVS